MRAVVLDGDALPELVDLPEPTGGGLLVRVRACGLCGSDVEKIGRGPKGAVLGHEIAGELENGARVTLIDHVPCGTCDRCLAGHQTTCGEFRASRIDPGGFAEYVRATHAVPLPEGFGDLAAVYVEPLACILRAAARIPRGRVLVVGCGAIGLLFLQVLRARGDEVAALDPRPDRLARAVELGAAAAGEPVDAAVVCAHGGLGDAVSLVHPGGTVVVFAAPFEPVPTDLAAVYRKELTIVGSRSATPSYFRDAVELMPSLWLPDARRLPLERFAEGLDLYRNGDALKIVFEP